ncbi:Protein PHYTOCHROME KINASE SUBSTRATE 4 [Platanthera guangdongensis]|uniref:Protein PHYTOCHROME KINASE SUBSTRATE 4 n=1 Tax=Platanthera guangdongensis TaxID=2320717 RepID=A0ABR2MHD9_9ASPA
MERCRVNSSVNGLPPQRGSIANFFPTAPSQISLPPKLLLTDSQIYSCTRPNSAKLPGDCLTEDADDMEISIFDADRYFNGSQDSNSSSNKPTVTVNEEAEQRESSVDGFSRSFRPPSFRATPTASSDASWNSQTGLLRKQHDNLSVSVRSFSNGEQKKEQSSSGARYFFGYRCPCSGKKSVDVEEKVSETKSSSPSTCVKKKYSSATKMPTVKADECLPRTAPPDPGFFSFNHHFPAPEIARRVVDSQTENASENPGRVSLEVFRQPETVTPLRNSAEFQKSPFARVSGDRRIFKIPGSPNLRLAVDDDAASDASSDLFEIDSLSTQAGFRRRDSLDELPAAAYGPRNIAGSAPAVTLHHRGMEDEEVAATSIAPSECYAPSEDSVDWSVTTAEGFDRYSLANFSSAVSEYEELRYAAEGRGGWKKKGITGGGLLSCRSEKAVKVIGPQPTWFEPDTRRVGKANFGLDRVVGVARLGGANTPHDGSVALDIRNRGRSSMIEPAKPDQVFRRVGVLR